MSESKCACGHGPNMHPKRMTGRVTRREKCFNESCHCARYDPLPPHTAARQCLRCSNFALEGHRHCRHCMKELAAAGKGPTTYYPCAWCGTWEASRGDDLCPKCAEADRDSPATPPKAVDYSTPVWNDLRDVPLDTVVEDHYGDHILNTLRTRIIAALARADQDWCSDNNLHEDMADAVIRELSLQPQRETGEIVNLTGGEPPLMSDSNDLRTRIGKTLHRLYGPSLGAHPDGWEREPGGTREMYLEDADAVIRELNLQIVVEYPSVDDGARHNGGGALLHMERIKPRWRVCKRDGAWRIYDRGVWSHTYQTLTEAHTEATQNAVADTLYQPGGLTLLAEMKNAYQKELDKLWNRW